eukprot:TRINITY_DN8778_c0_g1_i1.p1 TRINITY_DN8778_c0_g1~~TRINITY_DN8778_c0_g1_i1.p1  ORF type:complete len:103 (-),score=17.00 TRINITY_DN8778_c0_g1_i1:54-362(-)
MRACRRHVVPPPPAPCTSSCSLDTLKLMLKLLTTRAAAAPRTARAPPPRARRAVRSHFQLKFRQPQLDLRVAADARRRSASHCARAASARTARRPFALPTEV